MLKARELLRCDDTLNEQQQEAVDAALRVCPEVGAGHNSSETDKIKAAWS